MVISLIMAVSMSIVIVMVVVSTMISMVWSVVFWNVMVPAVIVIGISCIVGIYFMLV